MSPATVLLPNAAAKTLAPAGAAAPDFALALTALLLPGARPAIVEGKAGERQAVAGTGKELPEDASEKAEDEGDEAADAPFAWFATAPLPIVATPLGIQLPRPAAGVRLPEGEIAELRLPGAAFAKAGFAPAEAKEAPAAASAERQFVPPEAGAAPTARIELPAHAAATGPARIELPRAHSAAQAVPQATPQVQPPASPALAQPVAHTTAPVQPLAAPLVALHAAELPAAPRRPVARDLAAGIVAAALHGTEPVQPAAVAAVPDAQQPAIDTRRHEWMAAMIDRIDALRDSPGSRETTIRLTPDALGTVDVSIRQEGDRVHVRIHADTPQARALLAEAQPRLAELAEARGIRLGQNSVETGIGGGTAGQGGQTRQEAPRAPLTNAPTTAPAGAASEPEFTGDDRVA